jgi:hypothetical protein
LNGNQIKKVQDFCYKRYKMRKEVKEWITLQIIEMVKKWESLP